MKRIWIRLGATLSLTDEELDTIFNQDDLKSVLVKAIDEGRYEFDGDTYVPEVSVSDFNRENGTDYEARDYDCVI